MATMTQAEIRNEVLRHLGVLAGGETASAEDAAVVETVITATYGELEQYAGTIDWDLTAVPEWAQTALRDVVALRVAGMFGTAAARVAELAQTVGASWALLARHVPAWSPADDEQDVMQRALVHLGAIRPGEAIPAALEQVAQAQLDDIFAWYADRGTLGFDATSIPERARLPLRDMLAYRVARSLGQVDPATLAELTAANGAAIGQLDRWLVALGETDTKLILANRVLQHLGAIGLAELSAPGEAELLDETIDQTFDFLSSYNMITFETSSIPDWAMLPLRDVIAYRVASSLRVDLTRAPQLKMDYDQAMRDIRAQQRIADAGEPIKADYF